ncbi:MAG TPA: hypothetical protein VGU61_20030 [Noviherbaspirillum sp.]|jgi:hypothetical protein|uniref:hypothetical protein n=1 Tax=Noviherbaspirillum sp. TaxID=1926288 RepID=UPI002DDCB891|nr:hypothetical protein [Noviherbaspirillum sp.]HEV2612562.1 hypothetical protein [Noviherbaspirillum sp.]
MNHQRTSWLVGKALLIGLAGGVAAVMWLRGAGLRLRNRRYGDTEVERRNPMHFFLAGKQYRRRKIDRSGSRPLLDRRHAARKSEPIGI